MNPAIERAIGRALRRVRAGERHLIWNAPALRGVPASISLASSGFVADGIMPLRFAGIGVGENKSPPLAWSGVPSAAAELVLAMEDPDAPLPRPVVHLIATNIPATWRSLAEGALSEHAPDTIRLGRGSFGRPGYAGPRPVCGHGPHRYIFQIFAVDRPLAIRGPVDRSAALASMAGHVLARGRLVGVFERP